MLAFFLTFIHFLVIFSLFRGKTTLQAKYYYNNYFRFSKVTQKQGVALNDLSIQVKNVIWLPLKTYEQLSRQLIWTCL